MPTKANAFNRVSDYYEGFVSHNRANSDLIYAEFPQIQPVLTWLSSHSPAQYLKLFMNLSSYLETRSLFGNLLDYCRIGLRIAGELNINPARLLILTSEALYSLGDWEEAVRNLERAVTLTKDNEPSTYAQAILTLGRLQINKGDYRSGLKTLKAAAELFSSLGDLEGVATAKSEMASYSIVIGDFEQALKQYVEVNDLLQESSGKADQAAFMLGVVHRRLKQYTLSIHYLKKAFNQARFENNLDAMATTLHHMAWVYYDLHQWNKAQEFGVKAKLIYQDIRDIRGESDANEQLGLIAFHENDYESASLLLEQALLTRLQLGNQPGAASTIHRLATVYFRQGRIVIGLQYLFRSFLLYYRMRVLSRQRIIRIFRSPFSNNI